MEEIPGVGVRPLRGVGGLELLLVVSLDGSDLGLVVETTFRGLVLSESIISGMVRRPLLC